MTFRSSGRTSGRAYHHGNLRDALAEAALDLIAERGLAALTLAEVARAVGVSPAAPYRHFRDLDELVAEVARRGFERFTIELDRAWAAGSPTPLAAIEAVGRAYLDFARREPAAYGAMFDPSSAAARDAALDTAAAEAFGVMRRAAEMAVQSMPARPRPPALMVALHLWALAHGCATLFVGRGGRALVRTPMPPEALLEAGLLIYLQALGLPAPDAPKSTT